MRLSVQFGQFEILLFHTLTVEQLVCQIKPILDAFLPIDRSVGRNASLVLIATLSDLSEKLLVDLASSELPEYALQKLSQVCYYHSKLHNLLAENFRNKEVMRLDCTEYRFSVFIVDQLNENSGYRILIEILSLVTRWHIVRDGLCLHSSAIARYGKDGFLFLGNSDAGKTTTAVLSSSVGYPALGDDLNFIIKNENGYALAAAPSPRMSPVGYSTFRPLLRGIFSLVKDTRNYLVPLSQLQITQKLFESFQQVPKTHKLPDNFYEKVFFTLGNIARSVPSYELHFHKSPDFWKLIDAEFPD